MLGGIRQNERLILEKSLERARRTLRRKRAELPGLRERKREVRARLPGETEGQHAYRKRRVAEAITVRLMTLRDARTAVRRAEGLLYGDWKPAKPLKPAAMDRVRRANEAAAATAVLT